MPKKEPVPPLIKVREVAKLLSVSRHTVHALIECGDLKAERVNPTKIRKKGFKPRPHVRVTRDSLLKFYQGRFGHPLDRVLANPFAIAA
jgi:excisionase family DNA binding protein